MVDVAQLVRVSDCGSEGRGFETHLPPLKELILVDKCLQGFFCLMLFRINFVILKRNILVAHPKNSLYIDLSILPIIL